MTFLHTNASSFERFCCAHYEYPKYPKEGDFFERLYNATKMCFSDLQLSVDEQIGILVDFIREISYHKSDCHLGVSPCSEPTTPSHIGYLFFWGLLLVTTVISNLFVIIAVHKVSCLRKTSGNFLISSLAVSDLLVGSILIPIKMKFAYHNLSFCSIHLCRFYITADNTLFSISITNLLFISIDRYIAVDFPFEHRTWLTLLRCKFLIAGIWIYGFTWGALSNINWLHINEPSIVIRIDQCLLTNNVYVSAINILVFYIPAVAVALVYFRIWSIARKHARAISVSIVFRNKKILEKADSATTINSNCVSSNKNTSESISSREPISTIPTVDKDPNLSSLDLRSMKDIQTVKFRKVNWKASKTVATVYFTFFFCWFPVSALSLALAFCRTCFDEYDLKWFYLIFVEVIPIFHSMTNPFIYGFMNKEYRRAYKRIFAELKCTIKSRFRKKRKKPEAMHAATTTG